MLLAECAAAGVDVKVAHRITGIDKADHFTVATDHGAFASQSLVLATGGLSIPKMGATALPTISRAASACSSPRRGRRWWTADA